MRERRRPNHPVHVAMRSKISDTSVIQIPVAHVLAKPRAEMEKGSWPYLERQRCAAHRRGDVPYHAR